MADSRTELLFVANAISLGFFLGNVEAQGLFPVILENAVSGSLGQFRFSHQWLAMSSTVALSSTFTVSIHSINEQASVRRIMAHLHLWCYFSLQICFNVVIDQSESSLI